MNVSSVLNRNMKYLIIVGLRDSSLECTEGTRNEVHCAARLNAKLLNDAILASVCTTITESTRSLHRGGNERKKTKTYKTRGV